jgi:hypothetical protein
MYTTTLRSRTSAEKTASAWLRERARRFRDLFGEAVQELVVLHEQQFLAVVAGDPMATRFDILIHQANERKQNAKYAYMRHLEEHGCLLDDETDTR